MKIKYYVRIRINYYIKLYEMTSFIIFDLHLLIHIKLNPINNVIIKIYR